MCNSMNDETFLSIQLFSIKFLSQAFQCDFLTLSIPPLSLNLSLPSPINSLTEANYCQKSAISSGLKKGT